MTNIEIAINELSNIETVIPIGKRHTQSIATKRYNASMALLSSIRAELEADGKLDTSVDAVLARQKEEIYKDADLTPYVSPVVSE